MEDPSSFSSPKVQCLKASVMPAAVAVAASPIARRGAKSGQPLPIRLHTEQRGQMKEQASVRKARESAAKEAKHKIPVAHMLPTTEKPQSLPKPPAKEQTKPLNIRLHTEERSARRAGYNGLVAGKIRSFEILRRFEEKLQKVIEEEEIKILRKEMVPKAQLMPFFDRPFCPQRSRRPLTVPKEPNFHWLKQKSCGGDERCKICQHFSQQMKAIR